MGACLLKHMHICTWWQPSNTWKSMVSWPIVGQELDLVLAGWLVGLLEHCPNTLRLRVRSLVKAYIGVNQ